MKREVIDCDRCGKECDPAIHIAIPNGVEHEFGGHKTETYFRYEQKDLCAECAGKLLQYMFRMKKHIELKGVHNNDMTKTIKWLEGNCNLHPSADQTHRLHGIVVQAYHAESTRRVKAAMGDRWGLACEELYPHTKVKDRKEN